MGVHRDDSLCKGLAVKGRLKIVEMGSRVEGRLFLGEEERYGNTWGEEQEEGTQEAE